MLQVTCHVKFAVLTFRVPTFCAVQAQAAVSAAGADEVAKAEAMIAVEVPGLLFVLSSVPFKFVNNLNLFQVSEALVAAAQ